jgi:hypothetical protein
MIRGRKIGSNRMVEIGRFSSISLTASISRTGGSPLNQVARPYRAYVDLTTAVSDT